MFQVGLFVSLKRLQREDSFFGQKETGAERVAMATVLRASFCFFVMGNYGAKFLEHCFNISTLRAESPSIFLDKSGRGRRLCEWLQDSLIRCSSEKMDESVQFPVGQTGFY